MDKWGNLIKECTRSLHDDPELELDVAAELRGHLEDKVAELTDEGVSEVDAQAEAIKTFGDPLDIGVSLQEANFRRMKLRSRWRLIIKLAVIPVTLVALWLAMDFRLLQAINTFSELQVLNNERNRNPGSVIFRLEHWLPPPSRLSADEKLICYGDLSRSTRYLQQKAIWERFPDNKVYLANYINAMNGNWYEELPVENMIAELEIVKKLDPDNAYYNYLLCYVYIEKAKGIEWVAGKNSKNGWTQLHASVGDRNMLDLAMKEFAEGLRKPYCRHYINEMLQQRRFLLCPKPDFAAIIDYVSIYSATTGYHHAAMTYRDVARIVPFYGGLLLTEGKKQDAQFYFNAWLPMTRQINKDSQDVFDMLFVYVVMAVQKSITMPEVLDPIYKDGTTLQRRLATAIHPLAEWDKERKIKPNEKWIPYAASYNTLSAIPRDVPITMEILTPMRMLEYCLAEKIALGLMGLLVLAMIVFLAVNAGLGFFRGQRGFLLFPGWRDGMKIFLFGLVFPLGIYLLATRIDFLSGREYNIGKNRMLFFWQIGWCIMVIPVVYMVVYGRWLGRRCQQLGIDSPPGRVWFGPLLILFLSVLAIGVIAFRCPFGSCGSTWGMVSWTVVVGLLPFVGVAGMISFLQSRFRMYKLVFYSGMIPGLAVFLLLLTGIVRPCLDYYEQRYVLDRRANMSEDRITTSLKAKVTAALVQAEKIE